MAAVLDHIHMGSTNSYLSAYKILQDYKIGHYDGGFMSSVTINHKAVPLGGMVYIEIESIVDPFAVTVEKEPWFYKKALASEKKGGPSEIWSGLCLRVDTMEELGEIAKRHNSIIRPKAGTRTRPDGPMVKFQGAPQTSATVPDPWETGYPNWYCWEDRMYCHPSGQPVIPAPNLVKPMGVAWLEMGGDKATMQNWLGQVPDTLSMKFNGKSPGLYAVAVATDMGEVVIRRPSATQDI